MERLAELVAAQMANCCQPAEGSSPSRAAEGSAELGFGRRDTISASIVPPRTDRKIQNRVCPGRDLQDSFPLHVLLQQDPIREMHRREIPVEDPFQEGAVVVSTLVVVAMSKIELVRDLEQRSLIFA